MHCSTMDHHTLLHALWHNGPSHTALCVCVTNNHPCGIESRLLPVVIFLAQNYENTGTQLEYLHAVATTNTDNRQHPSVQSISY